MKKVVRYGLSWGVTLGMMVWILHHVPWRDVWDHANQVRLAPLLVACLLSLIGNLWLACDKYRTILRVLGADMTLKEVVILKMGSIPLKNLLPFKSGEILRVVYLQRTQGLSYLRGGGVVILNFGLSLAAIGFLLVPGYLEESHNAGRWLLTGALAGLIFLLFIRLNRGRGLTSGDKKGGRFTRGVVQAWQALAALGWGPTARLLIVSTAFEGIKVANYYLLFGAMGLSVPWEALFQVVPLLILISGLPIGVMGLGIREGGILLSFEGLAQGGHLVGAGLWISFVESGVPLLAGLFILRAFMGRLLNGIPQTSEKGREGP